MPCLPPDLYFTTLQKEHLPDLLTFYITEIYEHFAYLNYTREAYEHELESLLKEDNNFFNSSIYYILKDLKKHQIHGSIRLTYWDKRAQLPIKKLFQINPQSLIKAEIENYWHIGRFVISQKLPSGRISTLKQMLFNAFYPVHALGNGLIIAECDKKVTITLEKLGIECVSLGKSIEYICSETLPIYIKSESLYHFINSNYQRYCTDKNIHDTNEFIKKRSKLKFLNNVSTPELS